MENARQIDLARLAAYIDGEGCILIHRQRQYSQKAKPNWKPHYIVQVTISNTDPRLIVWLKENFGGFVVPYTRKEARHKKVFHWIMHSKSCADLLTDCLPYFIVKRKQAEIAIAFRKTYSKEYVGRGRSVPDSVIAERDAMVEDLKNERATVPEMIQ